ncbi:MAG: hypothetical protein M1600_13040, partial [Firmicutes bacterium]|nr:hypothetical protein [Bacillota bacterium]
SVSEGSADAVTLSGVPSNATVTWSITSSNASTGLVSGTSTGANFVGTAPGTYTIQASVNGVLATATVTVYGQAAGVTLTPATSTVVADGEATDAVTLNVVDSAGNTVADFNGTVDVSAQSGVDYWQNGSLLPQSNGVVAVSVTDGTATFNVGDVPYAGISIPIAAKSLSSSNGQSVPTSPTLGTATITTAAQVATSLKIVGAPQYLNANTAQSATMSVVVEDQAGYPMLMGTNALTVSVTGAATLENQSNGQVSLAYDGYATMSPDAANNTGDTNNTAQFTVVSQQGVTGPITITASGSGLTSTSASIQAVIAGAPSQLAASLSVSSFEEGVSSTPLSLSLTPEDANGVPVAVYGGEQVNVTVSASGSTNPSSNIVVNGNTLSPGTATVPVGGPGPTSVSIANALPLGADAGTYNVTISPSTGAAYSFPTQTLTFTETAGTASTVSFSPSTPVSVPVGTPKAQYTLQLEDTNGNPVAQSGVNIQAYASPVGTVYGAATVNGVANTTATSPVTVTTNAQGQATFTLSAEPPAGAQWVLNAEVNGSGKWVMSNPMTVVNQVPGSLTVAVANASQPSDTSYFTTGDEVYGTISVENQFGGYFTPTHQTKLTITVPAGLSGPNEPTVTSMVYGTSNPIGTLAVSSNSGTWAKGQSNTLTYTGLTTANGQISLAGLEAWTEGPATLSVTADDITASVSGSTDVYVAAGQASGVALLYNGAPIPTTGVPGSANTAIALTVESVDQAGNPVATPSAETVTLGGGTGYFRSSPTAAQETTVTIPAGQTSVVVYYISSVDGPYTDLTATKTS